MRTGYCAGLPVSAELRSVLWRIFCPVDQPVSLFSLPERKRSMQSRGGWFELGGDCASRFSAFYSGKNYRLSLLKDNLERWCQFGRNVLTMCRRPLK